ncbi:MAG: lipopolysaccharide transport periplasmic protein LptA [Burkholderiaceae bacterium]
MASSAARRDRIRSLALCAALAWPAVAPAEKADRDKPINVEADRMQYDDLKQINVFTGNVVLTKGTMILRADRVVVRQDPDGYQYATGYGNPNRLASFRQKRDGVDEYVDGQALTLDYDGKTEIVTLDQKAAMKKLEKDRVTDEVHGNRIVYQSQSEFFTVESGAQSASSSNPAGRVRVVIQPKSDGAPPPAAAPAPAPQRLKPDERLDVVPGMRGEGRP